jgi:hypothetical protein
MSPNAGGGGSCKVSATQESLNRLWRSNSILNLCVICVCSGLPPQHLYYSPPESHPSHSPSSSSSLQGHPKYHHHDPITGQDSFSDFVTLVCQEGGGPSRSPKISSSGGYYGGPPPPSMYAPPPPPMSRPLPLHRSGGGDMAASGSGGGTPPMAGSPQQQQQHGDHHMGGGAYSDLMGPILPDHHSSHDGEFREDS